MTPEGALQIGIFYMVAILLAMICFWCILLIGATPFKVQSIAAMNEAGAQQRVFHVGDLVSIRRVVCSDRGISTQYRPYLTSDLGQLIPMLGGVTTYQEGCHQYGYAFIMPALPPGAYQFNSTVIYSANLVGRDEFFNLPGVDLEVAP